jgi:hypothetical protein
MGEIRACERGVSAQKYSADAPAEVVIDSFFSFFNIFASRQSHGSFPFKISNGELVE